ncbi:MAG: shikimate kinase [Bacteroidota bacterium]
MPPSPRHPALRVYLAGFSGSGKSTVGPVLANALGFEFVDLDDEIERIAGVPIARLFRERGEQAFRSLERDTLREVSRRERIVVALGGGALADPSALAIVREGGVLVYLRAPLHEIIRRMSRKEDRPLLLAPDGRRLSENLLRQRVSELLKIREPAYLTADVTVDTSEGDFGKVVDHLTRALSPLVAR